MKDMRAFVSEMETNIGLMKRHADLEVKRNIYGDLSSYEREEFTELSKQVEDVRNTMLEGLEKKELKVKKTNDTKLGKRLLNIYPLFVLFGFIAIQFGSILIMYLTVK